MMFYAVFVQPESPGNIGSLARIMKNFGIEKLVLVDPCEITEETYKFAVHARDIVDSAIVVKTFEEALNLLDFSIGTTSVYGGKHSVHRISVTPEEIVKNMSKEGKIGIVIGRESSGLTNEELLCCDILVTIPTSKKYPVLNASLAAGIIFYEIYKTEKKSAKKLSKLEKDLLVEDYNKIVDIVEKRDYKNRIAKLIFNRVISRSFITSRESHTLKGIFRNVLKRLD